MSVALTGWDRAMAAAEAVRERMRRAAAALGGAGVPYAVIGGNAVAEWVGSVDEAAVRNTRDVDILLRRADFPAAKAALEAATRYIARDLGPKGIRVNAISAGAMRTLSLAGISGGRGMIAQGRAMSAMKEDTSMEGVAGAALWLCSDLGLSTTGEIVHVDAGFHMMGMAADEE